MYDGVIRPRKAELARPIHNAAPYFYNMIYNNIKYVFTLSNDNIVEYVGMTFNIEKRYYELKNKFKKDFEMNIVYESYDSVKCFRKLSILKLKYNLVPTEYNRMLNNTSFKKGSIDKILCPYCSKLGGKYIMKRWHFNNCKINQNK